MKTITVGFSRNKKILSKIICLLTKSDVSHTYIKIPVPEYNTNMMFQAAGLNVHYMNEDVFKAHGSTIVEEIDVEVTDEQYARAEKFRVTECGKAYSVMELIGYLWVLLNHKIGRDVPNPFYDGDTAYVCVEVVTTCTGINDRGTLVPETLRQLLKKSKDSNKR